MGSQSSHAASAPDWFVCAALAWGVLAFGAVYPWGYLPLAILCLAGGIAALRVRGRFELPAGCRAVVAALALILAAVLLQLVPVPLAQLRQLSPRGADILANLDLGVAFAVEHRHSISLDPQATLRGIALFVAFATLMVGVASSSSRRALRLTWVIACLGAIVALIGIIQKPLYHGALYGFWIPQSVATPFGPFVNRNHFAGWTVMALPLAIGYVAAAIDQARDHVRASVRGWIAWAGTPAGSRAQHAAVAALLMGLALALSLSRSGIASLIAALTVCGIAGTKRRYRAVGRTAAVASMVATTALIVVWASPDALAARFAAPTTSTLSGRLPIWTLDLQMARDFWATGAGLNAYSTATLFYPEAVPGFHLHEAHNDYLQLAIEGGLLVGVPLAVAALAFCVAVRRRFRGARGSFYWVRLGAVTGIVGIGIQSFADFSLQMPGNAALFATLCGLALHEERDRSG